MEKCWNCGADKENPNGLCGNCGRFPVLRDEERLKEFMKYKIYTDGSCSGNPGPGGWAAIVISPTGQETEYYGYQADTTNIRMELVAVGRALHEIPDNSVVEVYHDLEHIGKWLRNEYKRRDPTVKLLCDSIDSIVSTKGLTVTYVWTRGHANDAMNNRVDKLAVNATKEGIKKRGGN
jgi:ribonuclease HI